MESMEKQKKGPIVLVVLDGWGIEAAHEHNGITQANTPCYDSLLRNYPHTTLHTSGEHVGLPEGQMGNSEVGHTTIGAGAVIYQDLVRITKASQSGEFNTNPAFREAFEHVITHKSQLHIIGLLSNGGVHSHEDHYIELIRSAKEAGVETVILHPVLDGRDVAPTASIASLQKLEQECANTPGCYIATLMGRYYAMDRDTNWNRTHKALDALWHGEGNNYYDSPIATVQSLHAQNISDEHIEPMIFYPQGEEPFKVQKNDSIIFTNFRTDRTKQLSQKLSEKIEEYNLCFVTMTDYGKDVSSIIAYEPQNIEHTLASAIAKAGLTQAHIAETEKYPHATYFLNGGRESPHENEQHVLIPSRKDVKTHDEAPEMMAKEICDAALVRLDSNDFIFINFANADMVGHTAKRKAIITAVETVDRELNRLTNAVLDKNGVVLVIADHGNAERMIDPATGEAHTAHTTNVVPCILVSNQHLLVKLKYDGGLKDVAPTILELLELEKSPSMTGESLLVV
jgi:2,3-bisphosphoglycerate-independent phosphoglycerate mutase